jgi:hypothetical protein
MSCVIGLLCLQNANTKHDEIPIIQMPYSSTGRDVVEYP